MKKQLLVLSLLSAIIILCVSNKYVYADSNESDFLFDEMYQSIDLYQGNAKEVVIPTQINGFDVKIISASAFKDKGITKLVIPETVEEIGYSAFENNQLTEVILPNSLRKIDNFAFKSNSINKLVLNDGLLEIGEAAFTENNITDLMIPSSVLEVGEFAFAYNDITVLNFETSTCNIQSGSFINNKLNSLKLADGINFNKNSFDKSVSINGASSTDNRQDDKDNKKLAEYEKDLAIKANQNLGTYGNTFEIGEEATYIIKNDGSFLALTPIQSKSVSSEIQPFERNPVNGIVKIMSDVKSISNSTKYSAAIGTAMHVIRFDDSLWGWGDEYYNVDGVLYDGESGRVGGVKSSNGVDIIPIKMLDNIKYIGGYIDNCFALSNDGKVYFWGYYDGGNDSRALIAETPVLIYEDSEIEKLIPSFSGDNIVGGTEYFHFGYEKDGNTYGVVLDNGRAGEGKMPQINEKTIEKWESQRIKNHLESWENNIKCQVNLESNGDVYVQFTEGSDSSSDSFKIMQNVKQIKILDEYVFFIKENNELWAMRWSFQSGTFIEHIKKERLKPFKVMDNVSQMSYANNERFIIDDNQTLWYLKSEMLDSGVVIVPQKITDNVKEFYVENYSYLGLPYQLTCTGFIIKNNDELWGFGLNYRGELGLGYKEDYKHEFEDGTGTDLVKLAENVNSFKIDIKFQNPYFKALLLKNDGTLWTWGSNSNGEVDFKTNEPVLTPIKIADNVALPNSKIVYEKKPQENKAQKTSKSQENNSQKMSELNTEMANKLHELGLFQGKSSTEFMPALEDQTTAAEAITLIGRALKWQVNKNAVSSFTDVPDWAVPYTEYAKELGITSGVGDGKFGVDQISGKRMFTWFLAALGEDKADVWNNTETYSDKYHIKVPSSALRNDVVYIIHEGIKHPKVGETTPLINY